MRHKWYFAASQDGEDVSLEIPPRDGSWEGSQTDLAQAVHHGLFVAGEKEDLGGRYQESPYDFDRLVEAVGRLRSANAI